MSSILTYGTIFVGFPAYFRDSATGHMVTPMPRKSLQDRIADADERGSCYLTDANEAGERGDKTREAKLLEKGQLWLDRSNKLRGNC